MAVSVADLCDAYESRLQVFPSVFRSYGGSKRLAGQVRTIKVDQNPVEVRNMLSESGHGRILVVDANPNPNPNPQCAVLGDTLSQIALDNGWAGVIVNGYIRDTAILKEMPLGVWALGTCPRRGRGEAKALRDIDLSFGGVHIRSGDYLYADEDDIIISENHLDT